MTTSGLVMFPNGTGLASNVPCAMRDGVKLATDIYCPPPDVSGPHPVLLLRTPYGKVNAQSNDVLTYAHPTWYAKKGYLVVVQDVRGRYASEGEFDALRNEVLDGYDAVEWCSALDNSTGAVGMYGMSYGGFAQFAAAAASPPGLRCISPGCISPHLRELFLSASLPRTALLFSWASGVAFDQARRAGAQDDARRLLEIARNAQALYAKMPSLASPELQLIQKYLPFLREWLTRDVADDEYWEPIPIGVPEVPALYIAGWYDTWVQEIINTWERQQQTGPVARLLVGPWAHVPWRNALRPGCNPGPDTLTPSINQLHLEWFDWHLKGKEPKCWIGKSPAAWYDYGVDEWRFGSLAESTGVSTLTLWSDGLATVSDAGELLSDEDNRSTPSESDVIVDNPFSPTPSLGGWSCCYEALAPIGPKNQVTVEALGQVAAYSLAPYTEQVTIQGSPTVELELMLEWLPSTVITTLCLVRDGVSINMARGLWRSPGDTGNRWSRHKAAIAMSHVALTLGPGDYLKLLVQCSSFPEVAVDPHVNGPVALAEPQDARVSRVVIQAGEGSVLRVPVASGASTDAHIRAAVASRVGGRSSQIQSGTT